MKKSSFFRVMSQRTSKKAFLLEGSGSVMPVSCE
jgi:hypothetical protein